ncbi:hypothetical protein OPV22_021569 [Ensete ventricosum]|uniref:Uncharacterized protein n=1 Tax=Ensete ventricosum TaxID=4639 RepID=A0AAV8QNT5_ENSVE|nr:hypothetical protein OPV22_021569 [Ensete ventricosum]
MMPMMFFRDRNRDAFWFPKTSLNVASAAVFVPSYEDASMTISNLRAMGGLLGSQIPCATAEPDNKDPSYYQPSHNSVPGQNGPSPNVCWRGEARFLSPTRIWARVLPHHQLCSLLQAGTHRRCVAAKPRGRRPLQNPYYDLQIQLRKVFEWFLSE